MKEPMADYAPSSGPPGPRRRRRLLWGVLLTFLAAYLVGEFVLESHIVVFGQGYLRTAHANGYGYDLRSLVRLHSLWNTIESRSIVLWKAEQTPVFGKHTEVDGHALTGRRSQERAENVVYSLQPDYTLKEITLSRKEANRVFALVDEAIKNSSLIPDDLWQTRIEPELKLVGSGYESQSPATNPAGTHPDIGQDR